MWCFSWGRSRRWSVVGWNLRRWWRVLIDGVLPCLASPPQLVHQAVVVWHQAGVVDQAPSPSPHGSCQAGRCCYRRSGRWRQSGHVVPMGSSTQWDRGRGDHTVPQCWQHGRSGYGATKGQCHLGRQGSHWGKCNSSYDVFHRLFFLPFL